MKEKSSGTGRRVCAAAGVSIAIIAAQVWAAFAVPAVLDTIFAHEAVGALFFALPGLVWASIILAPRGAGEVRHD